MEDSDDLAEARIEVWKRTATKEQLERIDHRSTHHEIRTHVNENRPVEYSMNHLNNISRSIRFNTAKEAQDRIERWSHQTTREQQEALPHEEAFQKVRQQIIEGQPEQISREYLYEITFDIATAVPVEEPRTRKHKGYKKSKN